MESDVFAIFRAFVLPFHGLSSAFLQLLFCLFVAFVLSFNVFSSVSIAHERTAVGLPYVSNHLHEISHLPIFLYFITSQKRFNSYQNDVIALISNHIINKNTNFASRKKLLLICQQLKMRCIIQMKNTY